MSVVSPDQLAAWKDDILEAIVTPDASRYGAAIRNKGRRALDALLSALDAAEKQSQAATASQSLVGEAPFSERLAHRFHEVYESLAPAFDYETRPESAVPWEKVPENNRRLMIAVCDVIEADLRAHLLRGLEEEFEALNTDHGAAVVPKGSDRPALDALEQAGGGESKSESGGTAKLSPVVGTDCDWYKAAVGLSADVTRFGEALAEIADSYPWQPYEPDEVVTWDGGQARTNRRIAREALDALSTSDSEAVAPKASAVSAPPPSVEALGQGEANSGGTAVAVPGSERRKDMRISKDEIWQLYHDTEKELAAAQKLVESKVTTSEDELAAAVRYIAEGRKVLTLWVSRYTTDNA